jgi:hypothetical protein
MEGAGFSPAGEPRPMNGHSEDLMSKQLVESLRGVGRIFAGDVLLRTVRYELSLWSDDAVSGGTKVPPSTSDGGRSTSDGGRSTSDGGRSTSDGGRDFSPATPVTGIDGHLDIAGIAEATVLAGPETLTLELEDGRRVGFRLTDTGGAIVGVGALQ